MTTIESPLSSAANDNTFRFEVTADKDLDTVLGLAFLKNKTTKSYKVDGNRLILSWTEGDAKEGWIPFLVPLDAQGVLPTIIGWLADKEPSRDVIWQDGHKSKGFRVYNESWGQIDDTFHAFVAIEPHWIYYGK